MCGISGFLGKKGKENIKYLFAYIINIASKQESRGKDSCGLFFRTIHENKECIKVAWGSTDDSVGDTSTINKFYSLRSKELIDQFTPPYIIVTHSRKSTGSSTIRDNAHPFYYNNIVGVHNGRIDNWNNFFKNTIGVDIENVEVDSEALIRGLSKDYKKVLENYEGAASIIWYDLEKDCTYVWCGAKHESPLLPERDLNYWETEDGIFISSEDEPLKSIEKYFGASYTINPVQQFKLDCVTVIKDGEIIEIIPIKRVVVEPLLKLDFKNYNRSNFDNLDKQYKENGISVLRGIYTYNNTILDYYEDENDNVFIYYGIMFKLNYKDNIQDIYSKIFDIKKEYISFPEQSSHVRAHVNLLHEYSLQPIPEDYYRLFINFINTEGWNIKGILQCIILYKFYPFKFKDSTHKFKYTDITLSLKP